MGGVRMSMYHYGNEIPRLQKNAEFQFQHDSNRFSLPLPLLLPPLPSTLHTFQLV